MTTSPSVRRAHRVVGHLERAEHPCGWSLYRGPTDSATTPVAAGFAKRMGHFHQGGGCRVQD